MTVLDPFAGPGGQPDECWSGLGTAHGNGYRTIRHAGRRWYLHRLSYTVHVGPIPDGLVVDHDCHNRDLTCNGGSTCEHRACWNPVHLVLRSQAANKMLGRSGPAVNARKLCCPRCGGDYKPNGRYRRCLACRQSSRTDTKRLGIGRAAERTHCPAGHAYDAENTYIAHRPDGSVKQRVCRECSRERVRARRRAAQGVGAS